MSPRRLPVPTSPACWSMSIPTARRTTSRKGSCAGDSVPASASRPRSRWSYGPRAPYFARATASAWTYRAATIPGSTATQTPAGTSPRRWRPSWRIRRCDTIWRILRASSSRSSRADKRLTRPDHARGAAVQLATGLEVVGEHAAVVPVPLRLEALLGIEMKLAAQQLRELRIAGQNLLASGEPMIGEVEAAAEPYRLVYQAAECPRGALDARLRMIHVNVEDNAGVALLRPGKEGLPVHLDKADRAVDDALAVTAQIGGDRGHEFGDRGARNIQLRNHLRPFGRRPRLPIDRGVIAVRIESELMGIRPVDLARRTRIVVGVVTVRRCLVRMRHSDEPLQLRLRNVLLADRYRRIVRRRPIAGEYPAGQKVLAGIIDVHLQIAVLAAIRGMTVDLRDQVAYVNLRRQPFYLEPPLKPQFDLANDAEEAVAADRQPKQLLVGRSVTRCQLALRVDERQRLDVLNEGPELQAAPVDIRADAASEREPIGACLLLDDRPLRLAALLRFDQVVGQVDPVAPGFDGNGAGRLVEVDNALKTAHVEKDGPGRELLAAHGVACARDGDRYAASLCGPDRGDCLLDAPRPDDRLDSRRVQPRMDVIDNHGAVRVHPLYALPRIDDDRFGNVVQGCGNRIVRRHVRPFPIQQLVAILPRS